MMHSFYKKYVANEEDLMYDKQKQGKITMHNMHSNRKFHTKTN